LEQVFQILRQDQWRVKLSKCSFAKEEVTYLGYVISGAGVVTCPSKVQAVASWPQPQNVKELRSFLGLAGYYRKFVKHFGIIARPLTNLLKKHSVFVWAFDHENAFQLLKTALVQAPVLVLTDFSKPFSIETDASDAGVGAVLMQDHHPIAYNNKSFGPKLKGLFTHEKEFVAILLAVEHWKSYLQLGEFHIYSDQKSLSHLNEQRLHTSWQQKVFTKLLGLNYRIAYKKGVENCATDALSRRPHSQDTCCAISVCKPKWLEQVVSSYTDDAFVSDLIAKLSLDNSFVPYYSWSQGLLR
jgi:hypothetical protein